MAAVPVLDEYLINFWQQVCDIAVDYSEVDTFRADVHARDKLINVLWSTQRDDLITLFSAGKTAADNIIDAVRGATPRPTLTTPVEAGDIPIYPLEFSVSPNYGQVLTYSYNREDFNPDVVPTPPLPTWWYIGSDLYRMVLRSDDYILNASPIEAVSGTTLGVWGANLCYGVISLELLHNGYASARAQAEAASIQIVSILNEKSRRNR